MDELEKQFVTRRLTVIFFFKVLYIQSFAVPEYNRL